jgi:D-serine deaminase-like pyridoxal phosphate-dependent protein
MQLDDIAFWIITTIISRPTEDRGILDAGAKSFSSDLVDFDDYGLILEYPAGRIYRLSEEHGHVDFSGCSRQPEIGEHVTVIVNHCSPVSNLFEEVVAIRGGFVEVVWPVAARAMVR